ncbi:protein NRT1/ PTR FAMILY 8.1 isoform X1 [Physcomitrium patens]|uniref:protein NRT1/ PTR FAMILY 8.1 isoform X1 n=1 Tax=Physcomitrium patens TaxID=3218 RepID=UPI000D176BEA|nr:protein NRT1/ PTR FAMILY 8.1-like [Physcomitrium patens]|eukprot:XP_024378149.1 protein NRT1/ PTR FAMILY 8.1-like [Physcomitrella patens]
MHEPGQDLKLEMLLEDDPPVPEPPPHVKYMSGSSRGKDASDKEEMQVDEGRVSDGSVDIRGHPCVKSKSGNWKACSLIFGCEVCERVAFYAISSNLVIYLTTVLHEDVSTSAKNVNNWGGTTFMTPLLGAFVGDAFLGRYWTITVSSVCYIVSLVCVTMSVSLPALKPPVCNVAMLSSVTGCQKASTSQICFFYFSLYLMALGAGGIKSCVTAFAGDQFDNNDPKEARRRMSFPNWWFVSISFGTMLSVSILVYVQDNVGWAWGYGVPTAITGLATLAFLMGTPLYRHQIPSGSPLTRVAQVLCAAVRKWNIPVPTNPEFLYEVDDASSFRRRLPHTSSLHFLDKAAVKPSDEGSMHKVDGRQSPWEVCTVTQVEEVKLLVRMLPIWWTNLMFSAVFAQVGTLFLNQGSTMDRHMGPNFEIPAASMPLFITATICIFLPLYDKYFVPFVRGFTGDIRGLTLLQRIGVGQILSSLSIAVAAAVEMRRLKVVADSGSMDFGQVPISIFWLLPQYVLTGICEVFISVGQMEFFLDQAPDSMRSLGNALYLSTVAVGSFVSSVLVSIVTRITYDSNGGWIGNNLNRSHMDYFYWLLAILSFANTLAFVWCARLYTYKSMHVRPRMVERSHS